MAPPRPPATEKLLDFKKIGAIMQKNFIVIIRDKTRLIPLLAFPIFMILVFGFTTGNIPKHIPTVIVAYDHSPLSEQLQQEIQASQVFTVERMASNEGEAKRLLDDRQVKVIIEIPPNMQADVDAGQQARVTIIVDESDSAIAATATQTMNTIVAQAGATITAQKVAAFQQSVGAAAQQLQQSTQPLPDQYSLIAAKTVAVETTLAQSKAVTDAVAQSLILALPLPTLYIPAPTTSAESGHTFVQANNSFLLEQPGVAAMQAEIVVFQHSSAAAAAAAQDAHAATLMAQQADQQTQARLQAYEEDVAKPLAAIQVFTQYDAKGLLQPLTYDEKPAYGTGKRPVDFLIPAIIALTIFQGAVMGMGRAVAGEKREGALTRVFLTPTSNATIIAGTLLFYIAFEMCRFTFLVLVAMAFFQITIQGSLLLIALIIFIYAAISTGLGMILSSMVHTEQQYMAMSMLISMPTMFLAGVFFPVQAMPKALQALANFLPITYASDALRGVMVKGFPLTMIASSVLILLLFLVLIMGTVFMVFKRDIE